MARGGASRPRERGELERLLALLMGRLGLRCGEVARLTLDEIDWRAGAITIYGKGHRDHQWECRRSRVRVTERTGHAYIYEYPERSVELFERGAERACRASAAI